MAHCLRVRDAAHSGGTRQARQSRHAASGSIDEDRPGSDAQLLLSTGGRARRRFSGRPRWTSPPFRRGRGPPPERAKPRSDETGRRRGARRVRAGHATAHEERSADRRSDRSRRCPRERSSRPGRSSTQSGERSARLAIDRASGSAIGSVYVWLVRCGCRRRSAIPAPALTWSRLAAGACAGGLLHARPGRWRRPTGSGLRHRCRCRPPDKSLRRFFVKGFKCIV